MNALFSIFGFCLLMAFCSGAHPEEPAPVPKAVAIEAEGAMNLSPPFRILTDAECNGGTGVTIPLGAGKPPAVNGRLRYSFQVRQEAEYRLWLRTWWTDGDSNSLSAQVDDQPPAVVGQDGTYRRWHWVKGPAARLSSGTHSLQILNREDGVSLDRLLLVPDPDFVPRSEDGLHVPSAWAATDLYFADDFARSSDAPSDLWTPLSGNWSIQFTLDPNKLPNFFSYLGQAEAYAITLTGYRFWRNYQVRCAVKPLRCESVGLVISHADNEHYFVVRWNKGGEEGKDAMELCQATEKGLRVLRKVSAPRLDGVWSRWHVSAWEDEVEVVVDGYPLLREKGVALSGGKLGLYVSRGDAAFDNLEVMPVRRLRGEIGSNRGWWEAIDGKWSLSGKGTIKAKGKRQGIALTGQPDWRDYEARVEARKGSSNAFGLISLWQSPQDFYVCEIEKGNLRLVRVRQGERVVLAESQAAIPDTAKPQAHRSGSLQTPDPPDSGESGYENIVAPSDDTWTAFAFRRVDAHLMVTVNGKMVLEGWDDSFRSGRPGLLVFPGKSAEFRNFEVEFEQPGDFQKRVESFTFLSPQTVDPTDVPDLTEEQYLETVKSAQSDVLRRSAKYYSVVGGDPDDAMWTPTCGNWAVANEQLQAAATADGLLYFNRRVPGDCAVEAEVKPGSPDRGAWGIVLQGDRRVNGSGYRLLLKAGTEKNLALLRGVETVAECPVNSASEPMRLAFGRSGRHWLGWLDGSLALVHEDLDADGLHNQRGGPTDSGKQRTGNEKDSSAPGGKDAIRDSNLGAGDEVGLCVAEAKGSFDSVTVKSLNHRGRSLFYLFDQPETDWLPVSGSFESHGGISCQRASSWVTFLGKDAPALVWHKQRFEGGVSLSLKAMEHSVWHGWSANPSHVHTAYENIGISIGADGKDVGSGYAIIVNGWTLKRSLIARKGKVVASVEQGPGFPVRYHGGHAPLSPRGSNIRVTLDGPRLTLTVNGVPVLSYEDPEPIREGMVGLWCWDAQMNLADVYITNDQSKPQSPEVLAESLRIGNGSIGRMVGRLDESFKMQR